LGGDTVRAKVVLIKIACLPVSSNVKGIDDPSPEAVRARSGSKGAGVRPLIAHRTTKKPRHDQRDGAFPCVEPTPQA